MSFRDLALLCSAAMVISLCTAQPQGAPSEERELAERIWEQMIAAKGGRERLYGVKTMVRESRSYVRFANPRFPNGEIHRVLAFAFPDREWVWIDSGKTIFGSTVIWGDLTKGFGYIGFQDGETRRDSDLRGNETSLKLTQLVYLNETRWLQPKPIGVLRGKEIPRGVEAIETMLLDERVDFWISRTDHLPVRIIDYWHNQYTHVLEPGYTFDFSDYHEIDGSKYQAQSRRRWFQALPIRSDTIRF